MFFFCARASFCYRNAFLGRYCVDHKSHLLPTDGSYSEFVVRLRCNVGQDHARLCNNINKRSTIAKHQARSSHRWNQVGTRLRLLHPMEFIPNWIHRKKHPMTFANGEQNEWIIYSELKDILTTLNINDREMWGKISYTKNQIESNEDGHVWNAIAE